MHHSMRVDSYRFSISWSRVLPGKSLHSNNNNNNNNMPFDSTRTKRLIALVLMNFIFFPPFGWTKQEKYFNPASIEFYNKLINARLPRGTLLILL